MKDKVGKAIMKIKSAEQIANTFSAAPKPYDQDYDKEIRIKILVHY